MSTRVDRVPEARGTAPASHIAVLRQKVWLSVFLLAACRYPPDEPRLPQTQPQIYTADGHVLGVERGLPEDPTVYVRLVIRPGASGPVRVELAPGWYLDRQGLRFAPDDEVHVEGWRVTRDSQSTIIAKRLRSGSRTLDLRDSPLHPLWQ